MGAGGDNQDGAATGGGGGPPGPPPRHDGDWPHRRAAAVRAYREWMPSGLPDPTDPFRVWRTVRLGGLADLLLLDTRLVGRDRPAAGRRPVLGIRRRNRSLLGPAQWAWLENELAGTPRPEVPAGSE